MKKKLLNKRGGALLIVMAIMVMLTLAAIMAVDTAHNDIELSFNQLHTDLAFYVAEAGLNSAYADLNRDSSWREGYQEVAFERGIYSVALIDSLSMPGLGDTVMLRATGRVELAHANLEALVVPELRRPFQYGMFGDESLTMDNNTCTDSYNADSGTYASTRTMTDSDVGSNGPVSMTNSSLVGGDATSAMEDGISLDHMAQIRGDTTTGVEPNEFDVVSDAEYQWAEDNSNAPAGFGGSGYTYNPADRSLMVNENQTMTLSAGTYYFSDIIVKSNSELKIPTDEKVVIYMSGNLELTQHSAVNPSGKPANLIIYSHGTSLSLGMNTELRAVFYGPYTNVVIDNNTDFFGAVMARRVEMRNNSCFHYDRSLGNIVTGRTGAMKMIAWKEY